MSRSPKPTRPMWRPEGSARRAFEELQPSARQTVLSDLADRLAAADVPRAVAALATELANLSERKSTSSHRALAYLAAVTLWDLRDGSTRTPLGEHLEQRLTSLCPDISLRTELLTAVGDLLKDGAPPILDPSGQTHAPLVVDGGHLYVGRMRALEDRLVEAWIRQSNPAPESPERVDAAVADVAAHPAGFRLTEEQAAAVRLAASQNLAVITGGPGTGKTSVIVAIVRVLVRLGLGSESIVLAAPTGKAAHRMREAVHSGLDAIEDPGPADVALRNGLAEPRTLHRLLGYRGSAGSFQHGADFPLPHRAIVVDETSMIDLGLMERLVSASRRARLILLGDAEQLPSVDAGAVLRDVIESPPAAVHLSQSHRMDPKDPDGRAILLAAGHINRGKVAALFGRPAEEGGLSNRSGVEGLLHRGAEFFDPGESDAAVHKAVRRYDETCILPDDALSSARRAYRFDGTSFAPEDRTALVGLLSRMSRHKILTVVRRRSFRFGAAGMNAMLHRLRLQRLDLDPTLTWAPGEPLIVETNDYDRGLFNGDLGIVARVAVKSAPVRPMAVFAPAGELRIFGLEDLKETVALAHALTVHKAQGSELDTALVLLPEKDLPLLSREVLYTAATRARRGVAFVGSKVILRKGVERHLIRHSGVAEKLRDLGARSR